MCKLMKNNVSNIISNIETPAFGFPSKLIIAKDTGLFKKKNALADALSDYLKTANLEGVELVFFRDSTRKEFII